MARLARVEVFAADEIAVVHVMTRTVRRCFLLGDDALTGTNYGSTTNHVREFGRNQISLFAGFRGASCDSPRSGLRN